LEMLTARLLVRSKYPFAVCSAAVTSNAMSKLESDL